MPELKPARSGGDVRTAALIAVIVVVLVTSATGFYLFSRSRDPAPRLDAPIEEVAKFVSDEAFKKLPFERQRRYMEVLDDREEELDKAYQDEKLNAAQYKRGLELGWFGKQIPRAEKYAGLSPQEQAAYIDQRLDKKEDKDRKKGKGDGDEDGETVTSTAPADGSASSGLTPVKRDEQSEKDIPRAWPPEWRDKWKKYREALKERREEREEAREESEPAPAQTATQPG